MKYKKTSKEIFLEYFTAFMNFDARMGRPGGFPSSTSDEGSKVISVKGASGKYPYSDQDEYPYFPENMEGEDDSFYFDEEFDELFSAGSDKVLRNKAKYKSGDAFNGMKTGRGVLSQPMSKAGFQEAFMNFVANRIGSDLNDTGSSNDNVKKPNSQRALGGKVPGSFRAWSGGMDLSADEPEKTHTAFSIWDMPSEEEMDANKAGIAIKKDPRQAHRKKLS